MALPKEQSEFGSLSRDELRAECSKRFVGGSSDGWVNYKNVELREMLETGIVVPPAKFVGQAGHSQTVTVHSAPSNGNGAGLGDRATKLAELLSGFGVDEDKVRAIATEAAITALRNVEPTRLVVENGSVSHEVTGLAHKQLPALIQELADGNHVFLTGGAASGKTYAAEQASEAFGAAVGQDGREALIQSYCQQSTLSSIMGYEDAQGRPVRSLLSNAVECGHSYIGDEFDAGNGNVVLALNAATSNRYVAFPGIGMTRVHDLFRCIVTGNTTGNGADTRYVGRNQQDAAVLDRFVVIHWEYDEALERARFADVLPWVERVQSLRRALDAIPSANRPRVVIGRAMQQGAPSARRGLDIETLTSKYVWAKMTNDDRRQIEAKA